MFREINQLFLSHPMKSRARMARGQVWITGSKWKLDWINWEDCLWSFVGQWGPGQWCSSILPLWQSETSAVISNGWRDFVVVGHLLGRIFA